MTDLTNVSYEEFLNRIKQLQDDATAFAYRYQCVAARLEEIGDLIRNYTEHDKQFRIDISKIDREMQKLFGYTQEAD